MNLVLLGPPGAGKGTQAIRISKHLGIPHISTGDMFRRATAAKTEMGEKASQYMNRGELVPDEIVIGVVNERLQEGDCASGFLLDGFPRTIAQAEALEKVLARGNKKLDQVLDIEVGEEELVRRLTGRRTCRSCGKIYHLVFDPPKAPTTCDVCSGDLVQREDDGEETVRNRLRVYQEQTYKLIDYYRKRDLLSVIDGKQKVETVFTDIEELLRV